jgi:altronate hydrolase
MSTESSPVIRLNTADNVVVAAKNLSQDQHIATENVVCLSAVDQGHKVATTDIAKGENVRKYGQIIGVAVNPIRAGEHVHTHNMAMAHFDRQYEYGIETRSTNYVTPKERAVFDGYLRSNGRVGTRNYIGVMATCHCSASVTRWIAQAFDEKALAGFPNVDGVVAMDHPSGCGLADHGDGIDYLRRTLSGWAHHPNFAGIVLIGHGCEINQIDDLTAYMNLDPQSSITTMNIQGSGGTRTTVEKGIAAVQAMLPEANVATRQSVPVKHLMVGLECGGSDAMSGITANPALGYASDLLVRHGGSVILSETPEIYGAEQLLVQRAVSREVGEKLIARIRWWEDYLGRSGVELNNNPSPGNKAGGLTTILEKSLGAVAKSGSTNLLDVYLYAEPVRAKGLVFMDTPGYDMVSVTGKIAGGANMICFTTGRGSVFGSKPVPTIKLATNTAMYTDMEGDMDINCGQILDGEADVEAMGHRIFQTILDTASGKKSKSELLGFGDAEFAPWLVGPTI